MTQIKKGLIKKAISGFYYVICDDELYECKAKGSFRKDNITPLVGDCVEIEIEETQKTGTVINVLPRKNEFTRPPIANVDKLFIVVSILSPSPNSLVIDKLITACEYKDIEPIIVITKIDLKDAKHLQDIYKKAGFKVISISNIEDCDYAEIHDEVKNCISAFAGNTGVGKSSLLNNIFPDLNLETAIISKKLGRGKHTTRHVELFPVSTAENINIGYVADTPGFGSMELSQYDIIHKDKLCYCFREFAPYIEKCKFTGCSHTVEKGCAVLQALAEEKIPKERFESYLALYTDAKLLKKWEV